MTFRTIVGVAVALAFRVSHAAVLSPSELRVEVSPFLTKPLPSIESIVGVTMPPAVPMLVVSSFGDDGAASGVDRGYAFGRSLNVLLFGASPRLDVEHPVWYTLDTTDRGVPTGFKRDSRANAYRVAKREAARWCAYGTVSGQPARVDLTVDDCDDRSAKRATFDVATEADWPKALEAACRFVLDATQAAASDPAHGCEQARMLKGPAFVAYARYAASGAMTLARLEAIVQDHPVFVPAVMDVMDRMPYDAKEWRAFVERRKKLVADAAPWPALVLTALRRHLAMYGWKLDREKYEPMFAFIRAKPTLRAGWLVLASALSDGTPHDRLPAGAPKESYHPNEVTHSAALALSLAYYANWPDSYRARWQMGYALQRYAWMLRGNAYWKDVPLLGKAALQPLMTMAAMFAEDALATQPHAPALWENRILTLYHSGGEWRPTFDRAVGQHPNAQRIYEIAMEFSQPRWGGKPADIERVEALARKNNPNQEWVKSLRSRHEAAEAESPP